MIALLAASLFVVVLVLHLVGAATVDVVLSDLGLLGICLALFFGNWPVATTWYRR
jgi:hypothetical protein